MNKRNVWSILFLVLVTVVAQKKKNKLLAAWAVEPSPVWNELKKNPIPEWMIDAKLAAIHTGGFILCQLMEDQTI